MSSNKASIEETLNKLIASRDVKAASAFIAKLGAGAKEACSKELPREGTALHLAARLGDIELVKLVLDTGVSVDIQTKEGLHISGLTALHEAVSNGHLEVVNFLLGRHANVNIQEDDGQTPLHIACQHPRTDIAELLIRKGADVNKKDNIGQTPLQMSILRAPDDTAILLLENGSDIHIVDKEGQTPLHYASEWGSVEIVKALLAKGADINCSDFDGQTPLHLAAEDEVFDFLVKNGANVNLRNKRGKCPQDKQIDMNKEEYQKINKALAGHDAKMRDRILHPAKSHTQATRTFSPGPPIPEVELKTARTNMLKELMSRKDGDSPPSPGHQRVMSPLAREDLKALNKKMEDFNFET